MTHRTARSMLLLLSGSAILFTAASPASAQTTIPCADVAEHGPRTSFRRCTRAASPTFQRGAEGAKKILARHARTLGSAADATDLVASKHGLSGSVSRFQQRFQGLPVFDAWVTVTQNRDGALRSLHSAFRKNAFERGGAGAATFSVTREQAIAAAHASFDVRSLRGEVRAKRVWMPRAGSELAPAWEVMSYAREPLGDFQVVIDAQSGEVLFKRNLIAFVTGSGFVYHPNPIQTSGNTSLSDMNDATSPALDAERVNVTLLGLDSGTDKLIGEFVDLVNLPGGLIVPDATEPTRVYEYDRSDGRFEQVVVYHAVDSIQRYFHSLGFDDDVGVANGIRDFPTLAEAHWYTQDQSFYSTGDDGIHFGDGGVDDGEDADIVIHEYGHAVQFDQNNCWGGGEMGAMGEGFGDYLAASFYAGSGDATHQASHAACVAEWDATSYSGTNPPCLRRVDGSKTYPGDLTGQSHADGEIWSAALWDLRGAVGGPVTDQLVLEHHFSLTCNASMTDAALEIVDVDTALFGGANEGAIRTAFCDRGILSGAECVFSTELELTKFASPNPVGPGERLVYTLTAENNTAGTLTDLVLSDVVPANTSYLPWSASDGGSESGGVVSWPLFDLQVGEMATRSFSVATDPALAGPNTLFSDDIESGGGAWTTTHGVGAEDWVLDGAIPHSGSFAWRAFGPATQSDQYLTITSALLIPDQTTLSFWHRYGMESSFDGGVVEISVGGGAWGDLGPYFTQNGYNGTINGGAVSAIAGRSAFTGNSGGYGRSIVDLSSFAPSSVQIRFRMATDDQNASNSWVVDDVELVSNPEISNSADVVASQGDDADASVTTPVVGVAAACGDAILQPGNSETCDDANTVDGDGCNSCQIILENEPVCGGSGELCQWLGIWGTAVGGNQVDVSIDGVPLTVFTLPGQTHAQVAAAIAQAINFDPTLSASGVLAQSIGGWILTTGEVSAASEDDPGLSFDPTVPAVPWLGLPALAAALVAGARLRRVRPEN